MSEPKQEKKVSDTADGTTVPSFDKAGKRTDVEYTSGFITPRDDQITPYIA